MATALLAALLGGCSFLSKEADATEVSSEAETESPGATQESETETTETEETQESHEAAEDEESGEEETEDHFCGKEDRGGNGYALFCRETGRKPL